MSLRRTFEKVLIGPYHWDFRPGKFTIYQKFTLSQVLVKDYKKHIETQHNLVDYKAAFDSLLGDRVYAARRRLCRIMPSNYNSSVKMERDLSEPSNIM